jgi:hypothetical protein
MLSAQARSSLRSSETFLWLPRSPCLSLAVTAASRSAISLFINATSLSLAQIVPLLSQSTHPLPSDFAQEKLEALVKRIQFGGDEVVKAKDGTGSATLSMAYAGAEFAQKVIRALKGEKGIVAPSYVSLSADPVGGEAIQKELGKPIEYFSARVELGVSLACDLSALLSD